MFTDMFGTEWHEDEVRVTEDYVEEWYDDGENDFYLGDPDDEYEYGPVSYCE